MKYICVQPRILYFAWQIEVMINNFINNGINPNDIIILLACNNNDETYKESNIELFKKLQDNYNTVNFYYYEDTREDMNYIPSIYFNILKQHIQNYPELSDIPLFLHDSDIIFTKPLNFDLMLKDKIWYLSDTNSYINSTYILSKGEEVYNGMCDIVGLDKLIPKLLNSNSGGGQHLTKGTTFEFWDKVEKDSIKLYNWFNEEEPKYIKKHESDYPIQKWTAGMWSLLWNAWLFGHETKVDPRLNFCWATDRIDKWDEVSIFHNAGVTNEHNTFKKFEYTQKLPYNDDFSNIKNELCSFNYIAEIQNIAKISCLI